MFNAITHSQIFVLDQDEALDFYVGKLGLEVTADVDLGFMRELLTKGAMGGSLIFSTDDCRKTYETLLGRGVELTEEPTERPYGTDCGLRDPFGNSIRFTQPKS
jgi:predicted enzyme related to lactoylglutathione lyase